MKPADSDETSTEGPSSQDTWSDDNGLAQIKQYWDMTGLSKSERILRVKELRRRHKALLEAELGLPPSTEFLVRR